MSIQGESTFAGLPCWFIRFAGCNLRCGYCDTQYAYNGGEQVGISELVDECAGKRAPVVEITGGEPLMQDGFHDLACGLRDLFGKTVLVETNGSYDISVIPEDVVGIVDVKTPSSGVLNSFRLDNIEKLRRYDEVKFVLAGVDDYRWARDFVAKYDLVIRCHAVLFSPVHGVWNPRELSALLTEDGLNARMQVQLHKVLGVK